MKHGEHCSTVRTSGGSYTIATRHVCIWAGSWICTYYWVVTDQTFAVQRVRLSISSMHLDYMLGSKCGLSSPITGLHRHSSKLAPTHQKYRVHQSTKSNVIPSLSSADDRKCLLWSQASATSEISSAPKSFYVWTVYEQHLQPSLAHRLPQLPCFCSNSQSLCRPHVGHILQEYPAEMPALLSEVYCIRDVT